MTLTELRYIVAVARERHFGRAATTCHVSQPTLSVAIKKLEDELGVSIFERGSSEISLSPVGERVVQQAQQALEAADNVKQVAMQGKNQLSGPSARRRDLYHWPLSLPGTHTAIEKNRNGNAAYC